MRTDNSTGRILLCRHFSVLSYNTRYVKLKGYRTGRTRSTRPSLLRLQASDGIRPGRRACT